MNESIKSEIIDLAVWGYSPDEIVKILNERFSFKIYLLELTPKLVAEVVKEAGIQ